MRSGWLNAFTPPSPPREPSRVFLGLQAAKNLKQAFRRFLPVEFSQNAIARQPRFSVTIINRGANRRHCCVLIRFPPVCPSEQLSRRGIAGPYHRNLTAREQGGHRSIEVGLISAV